MKVLNLRCANGHGFEGWFGSDDEFLDQNGRSAIECPLCADRVISRVPSAPRLNLSTARDVVTAAPTAVDPQAAWLQAVRHVLANTEDVGERFATEARRIHYGEVEQRGIGREPSAAGEQQRHRGREQRQRVLVAALVEEEALAEVHREDGDQHREGQCCRGRAHQHAEHQGQPAEELGRAGQQGHQGARVQADRAEELPGAFETVAAEPAEQLLRAVGDEDDAHRHAQRERAIAGIGGQQAVESRVAHGSLSEVVWMGLRGQGCVD